MKSRYRIFCVCKNEKFDHVKRITHISGIRDDGTRWRLAVDKAILGMECGAWSFFVHHEDEEHDVIIAESEVGHKYLKTTACKDVPSTLLNLPQYI